MFRSLLNHTTTASLIILVVGGTTAVALAATYLIRKAFPHVAQTRHDASSTAIKSVFALLYGLIFALSISNLSSAANTANSTTSAEATSLAVLVRATHAFSPADQIPLRQAIGEYDTSVVGDDFPAMSRGVGSVRTGAELDNLFGVYQYIQNAGGADGNLAAASIPQLDTITAQRRARLDIASQGLPGLLRLLLILGVVLLIVFSVPTKVWHRPTQLYIVGAITAFLSFAFSLTILLDYPFSGSLSVSPAVYKSGALVAFWPARPVPVPPANQTRPLTDAALVGLWNSDGNFGALYFKRVHGRLRAAYRHDNGTIEGSISGDGVFRGWWTELPGRHRPRKAGEVEFRLFKGTPDRLWGLRTYGTDIRQGTDIQATSNWALTRVGGAVVPVDLAAQFHTRGSFRAQPAGVANVLP